MTILDSKFHTAPWIPNSIHWIPDLCKWDCGFLGPGYSGFQSPGFWIPQAKTFRIPGPDSLT